MTDNTTIFKKIYIKDYLINTKLLNKSINNLLLNHLSNKFYKTKDINHKIHNIVDKINFLYKEDYNKNKIFNLAYQPYNQYNTIYNYFNNNYNKKWILPIVNHQKNLFINSFNIDEKTNKITDIYFPNQNSLINNNSTIQYIDSDSQDITFTNNNLFKDFNNNQSNLFSKTTLKEAPWKNSEVEVLKEYNSYNVINTNQQSSNNDSIVLRKKFDDTQIYHIEFKSTKNQKIIQYTPEIKQSEYELYNILQNENIDITHFLVLNPVKLLNTNYNIFLGNCISYINEIINTTHIFINDILNQSDESNYKYIEKNTFFTDYKNKDVNDDFVLNYLNIIKTYKNFDDVYSIRSLKCIYHMFGYDLNKIPECYISYLLNILDNNIRYYILNNTLDNINFVNKYKLYIEQNKNQTQNFDILFKQLYNKNVDSSQLHLQLHNSFDNGLLYYFTNYSNYIKSLSKKTIH